MAYAGGAHTNTVIVPAAPPGVYVNYANITSTVLGVIQIIIGIALIVPVIILYVVILENNSTWNVRGGANVYYFGGGYYILTGIFGIAAGASKTKCPIITFMILSIFASIIGVLSFIMWALVAAGFTAYRSLHEIEGSKYLDKIAAVIYTLVVLLLIESIVSIWSYIICCRVVCCGGGQQATGAIAIQTYQYPQNQIQMSSASAYPDQHYNSGYANEGSGMQYEKQRDETDRSHSSSRRSHQGSRY